MAITCVYISSSGLIKDNLFALKKFVMPHCVKAANNIISCNVFRI